MISIKYVIKKMLSDILDILDIIINPSRATNNLLKKCCELFTSNKHTGYKEHYSLPEYDVAEGRFNIPFDRDTYKQYSEWDTQDRLSPVIQYQNPRDVYFSLPVEDIEIMGPGTIMVTYRGGTQKRLTGLSQHEIDFWLIKAGKRSAYL